MINSEDIKRINRTLKLTTRPSLLSSLGEVYFYTWKKHSFESSRERLKAHRLAPRYNQSSSGDSRMTFKSLRVEFRNVRRKAFPPGSSRNFTIRGERKKNFSHHETLRRTLYFPLRSTRRFDCFEMIFWLSARSPTKLNCRQTSLSLSYAL